MQKAISHKIWRRKLFIRRENYRVFWRI